MTTKCQVVPGSPTALRAANIVQQHPGCTTAELAQVCCWSTFHTYRALAAARADGMIELTRLRGLSRWYSVADFQQVRDILQRQKREKLRALQRVRDQRRKERMAKLLADAHGVPDVSDMPVRRYVDASAPLPFVCRAPNSVFALGAV